MIDATNSLDDGPVLMLLPSRIERAGPMEAEAPPACPACGDRTVRRLARSGDARLLPAVP